MKTLLPLFLLVATAAFGQDSNRWSLFQNLDWSGRLSYLQDTAAAREEGDFLLKVLQQLDNDRIEAGTDLEILNKKSVAQIVMKALADHPVPGAAALIARVPLQNKDPFVRGEAWLALAKLGDTASAANMARELGLLNDSGTRSRNEEIQASYLVQALGTLKAESAFRSVIAASLGWYAPASGVKAAAVRTLPLLTSDVEAATLNLLANDPDLTLREAVFQSVVYDGDVSKAARAGSALLGALVTFRTANKTEQERSYGLTLAALQAGQKAVPPVSFVPSVKTLLATPQPQDVLVNAVRLLAKIDDASAVALLASTLNRYNEKQRSGANKDNDLQLVRELFAALASTGKPAARAPLNDAVFSNYSAAMTKEAQAALDKLPRG